MDRLPVPGQFPVGEQLPSMEAGPQHQTERPTVELTGEEYTVHCDGGLLLRLNGVEVRDGMVALVPVHIDGDPVEEAHSGHEPDSFRLL